MLNQFVIYDYNATSYRTFTRTDSPTNISVICQQSKKERTRFFTDVRVGSSRIAILLSNDDPNDVAYDEYKLMDVLLLSGTFGMECR